MLLRSDTKKNQAQSPQVKRRHRISKNRACVPSPTVEEVPGWFKKPGKKRSDEKDEERFWRAVDNNLGNWATLAPTFKLDVDWHDLSSRPKNTIREVQAAQRISDEMKTWEADCCSGIWTDRNGKPLVAYFADLIQPVSEKVEDSSTESTFYKPGPLALPGRTLQDIKAARDSGQSVFYHGFKQHQVDHVHMASQYLHSQVHPQIDSTDLRHPDDIVLLYDIKDDFILCLGVQYTPGAERTGVSHLVDAWFPQAHKDVLVPSSDMFRGSHAGNALSWYYKATEPAAKHLDRMFRISFPEQYADYRSAFDAGQWVRENPGPWLGRAIIHKAQVLMHRDAQDPPDGPAAIFNSGSYTGGYLYLPDLKLKLKYKPGDVVIFLAADLYHEVEDWKPAGGITSEGITPGRIGHVFFSPQRSLEALRGKEKGWFTQTFGGKWPSVRNIFGK